MSGPEDYVLDLLNQIAKIEGFSEYKINFEAGSKHGDGFSCLLTSAIIVGKKNNVPNQRLSLLCKLASTSASHRAEFLSEDVFEREALAYNKILPLFTRFQQEKGLTTDEGFYAFPKCFTAIADETKQQFVIIMEDLRANDFIMRPKDLPATADHAFLVIERLAKLHAISFAIKDQQPEIYEGLREVDDVLTKFFSSKNIKKLWNAGFDRAITTLRNKKHVEIIEEVKEHLIEYFNDCLKAPVFEPFGVIGHGDCWNNNMLFQYADEKHSKVKDVCFVDWQVIRLCSPVIDLLYNIFGSTTKEFRDKEYHNLMKHYHKTLSDSIRRLGSDPDQLFTFQDLQDQLKKFGKFAFLMGPVFVMMMVADPKDIPDMEELSKDLINNDAVEFVRGYSDEAQLEYERRINDLMTDLVEELGYYWK